MTGLARLNSGRRPARTVVKTIELGLSSALVDVGRDELHAVYPLIDARTGERGIDLWRGWLIAFHHLVRERPMDALEALLDDSELHPFDVRNRALVDLEREILVAECQTLGHEEIQALETWLDVRDHVGTLAASCATDAPGIATQVRLMAAELWPDAAHFQRATDATLACAWLVGRALDVLLIATRRVVALQLGLGAKDAAEAAASTLVGEVTALHSTANVAFGGERVRRIHLALGHCWMDPDPEVALEHFVAAANDIDAEFGAATCLIRLGRHAEAESRYRRLSARLRRRGRHLDAARASAGVYLSRWHTQPTHDRTSRPVVRGLLAAVRSFEANLPDTADPLTLYTLKSHMQAAYATLITSLAREPDLLADGHEVMVAGIWALLQPELLLTPRATVGGEPWSSLLARLQRPLGAIRAALLPFPGVGVIHAFPGVEEIVWVIYGYERSGSFRVETCVMPLHAAEAAHEFCQIMDEQMGADLLRDQIRLDALDARLVDLGDKIGETLSPAFVGALEGMDELYAMPSYEAKLDQFPIAGIRLHGEWLGHTHTIVRSPTPDHLCRALSPNRPSPRPNPEAVIAIGDPALERVTIQAANSEADRIGYLAGLLGFECVTADAATLADMRSWLGGAAGLVHYIGHGITTDIYEGLPLATGETLRVAHLDDSGGSASFVVLCACEMARSRSGPGGFHVGLASALVDELGTPGAVAFTTPLPETRAYDAIAAFYREALHHPVGRAACRVRQTFAAQVPSYVWLALTCYGDARLELASVAARADVLSSATIARSWVSILREHSTFRTETSLTAALSAAGRAPATLQEGLAALALALCDPPDPAQLASIAETETRLEAADELSDADRLSIRALIGLGRAHIVGIDQQPVRWSASDPAAHGGLRGELELVVEASGVLYDWGLAGLAQILLGRLLIFEGSHAPKRDLGLDNALDLLQHGAHMLGRYAETSSFCRRIAAETRASLSEMDGLFAGA
jgi:CHAT domain